MLKIHLECANKDVRGLPLEVYLLFCKNVDSLIGNYLPFPTASGQVSPYF